MFRLMPFIMLVSLLLSNGLLPSTVSADYYSYTDKKGVVHITNKLNAVPARYRSTMKVVREDPKPAPVAPAVEPAAAVSTPDPSPAVEQAPEEKPGTFAVLSARFPWFKPLVYVMAVFALFVAVTKVSSLMPSPLLSKAVYVSFFLGVMVFLYKTYVEAVVENTMKVKDTAVTIMKKSAVREGPAAPGDAPAEQKQSP